VKIYKYYKVLLGDLPLERSMLRRLCTDAIQQQAAIKKACDNRWLHQRPDVIMMVSQEQRSHRIINTETCEMKDAGSMTGIAF
jgi:hypothetical protein